MPEANQEIGKAVYILSFYFTYLTLIGKLDYSSETIGMLGFYPYSFKK